MMTLGIGNNTRRDRLSGFTLVEMSMVLFIIGLLAAFAWPSLRSMTRNISVRAAVLTLRQQFQSARQKAVITGEPVYVSLQNWRDPRSSISLPATTFYPSGLCEPVRCFFPWAHRGGVTLVLEQSGVIRVNETDQ